MADTPDPQELARRYLDLWQQHLTQAATDPDLAATMAKFWQGLSAGVASGMTGWPPIAAPCGRPNAAPSGTPNNDAAGSDSAPGPPSDPASSDGRNNDLDELLDRMAALEKRLDAMERKPRSGGKRAAKGTAKRKS